VRQREREIVEIVEPEILEPEVLESEAPLGSLSSRSRNLSSSDSAARDVDQADERLQERLTQKFDHAVGNMRLTEHKVGQLTQSTISSTLDETQVVRARANI
jgi:hypothetical protein